MTGRLNPSIAPDSAFGNQAAGGPRPAAALRAPARRRPGANRSRLYGPVVLSVGSVVAGIIIWQIIANVVHNGLFLAAPSQIVVAIGTLWGKGTLQQDLITSVEEFVIGFVLASAAGVPIGLVMASFARVRSLLSPWVSGFYATPIIALSPLLILWLGIGLWSKVAVVISVVIFPVIINTEAGVRGVDPQLIEVVRSFGATRGQIFLKISLPAAMPLILAGLRLGVGRGLIGVVVGELFGARSGLGFLINDSAQVFNMPALFAGVVILAALGVLLTAGFQRLEASLLPWR